MYSLEDRDIKKFNFSEIPKHILVHGQKVGAIAFGIAEILNYSHSKRLDAAVAGLYHDYGKIWVKPSILNKPGPLNEEEMKEMKLHVLYGSQIVSSFINLRKYREIIKYHHEYMDGSGYYGLKGIEIPELSKILTVADVYDALISDRVYRRAFSTEKALEMMEKEKHRYDKRILESLFKMVEKTCICCSFNDRELRKAH